MTTNLHKKKNYKGFTQFYFLGCSCELETKMLTVG